VNQPIEAIQNREGSDRLKRYHVQRGNPMKHSEGFLKIVDDAKSRIKEVSVEDTRARIAADPNARLIDVREDDEWRAAHAAGAIHLGKGIIERDIEATVPEKSTELILYCGGGYRSALAADVLQNMGYTNVWSMAGGWKAWKESGAPTES
jgi:rhodanese-related sulfurtransferase